MRLVVDANVLLSALIADSMTRRLIVAGNDTLLAPAYIHDEIGRYVSVVVEKTGEDHETVSDLAERLFEHVTVVPREAVLDSLHGAARVMREIDPNDALYLATALERDATIWSDDRDFHKQDLVSVVTTSEMVEYSPD
jgi:predicted nucleic acid-binding protein